MGTSINLLSSSPIAMPRCSLIYYNCSLNRSSLFRGFKFTSKRPSNGDLSWTSHRQVVSCTVEDVHNQRRSLESLFHHNKVIQEEINEESVGKYLAEKDIGDNPHCPHCLANGAVLCCTCSGSGLYVDSILESQGIIVKVECLGCGGTGNVLCSECGGRGHLGHTC